MAGYGEIQKLEQRMRENPEGRAFAPLADAYRKAGEVARALEIVRRGLLHHRDYVSGHIVLGRCLVDRGDDDEARQAFEHVLELDPENVIALRMLSEVAERAGAIDEALDWLERLLEVDPNNGEADDALRRLQAQAGTPPEVVLPVDTSPAADQGWKAVEEAAAREAWESERDALVEETVDLEQDEPPFVVPEAEELPLERAGSEAGGPGAPPPEPAPAWTDEDSLELETFDGMLDLSPAGEAGVEAGGIELEEEPLRELAPDEISPIEGLSATQHDAAMFEPPAGADHAAAGAPDAGPAGPDAAAIDATLEEWGAEPPELQKWSPGEEWQESEAAPDEPDLGRDAGDTQARRESALADLPVIMPDDEAAAAGDEPAAAAWEPEDADEVVAAADVVASAPEEAGDLPAEESPAPARAATEPLGGMEVDLGAVDRAALAEAEPVVTETMAELLVAQGHIQEARRVYRALLAHRPGDALLASRLEALGAAVGPAAPGELIVGRMFQDLVAARPRGQGRPSSSLESAFGGAEPGVAVPEGRANAPAVAEADDRRARTDDRGADPPGGAGLAATPGGAPTHAAPDALSLDQIFGEADEKGASPSGGEQPEAREATPGEFSFDAFFSGDIPASPPKPREAAGEDTDLDDFHNWLKGLKS